MPNTPPHGEPIPKTRLYLDSGFPTHDEYALGHRCPTCGAHPWQPCTAPRLPDPGAMHATRHDAGSRHRDRDVAAAPWPEDRVPGRRYDTLDQQNR